MSRFDTVTFVVVEDDDLDFETLSRALTNLKIDNPVRRDTDGIEALDMLKGRDGVEKIATPYLILLDLQMPRMGGLEFLENIRKDSELENAIIFVLTSSDSDKDIDRSYKDNVAGYIQKGDSENGVAEAIKMIDHYWKVVEMPRPSTDGTVSGGS